MKYLISIFFAILVGFPVLSFSQVVTNTNTPPTPVTNSGVEPTNTLISNTMVTNEVDMEAKRISNWTESLNYGIASQRLGVVKQIRRLKDTNMISILKEQFPKENSIVVKEEIIYIMIDNTNTDVAFWQQIFTDEKDMIALQRAAYAIEVMKGPDVGAQIFDKLTNELTNEKAIRFNANAVRALGELKYIASLPVITEIATNRDLHQDYRGSAVLALGIFKDTTQLELLKTLLTNNMEPKSIRRYAAVGIGRLESPEVIEILAPIATNETEEQSVRIGAITGLSYTTSEGVSGIMETLSKSDNTTLRMEAVKSLGRMKSEASRDILIYKAFNDPEAIVRREAKTALQAMEVDIDALEKERRAQR